MTKFQSLSEIADFVSGGTPSKSNSNYWGGNIPWVSAKDMRKSFLSDSEDHVTTQGATNGTRILPVGATLILVRGMTLHNYVPICFAECPLTINQDVKGLIPKANIRPKFLYYSLKGIHDEIHQIVDSAGHGTGRLNTDQLKRISIAVPSLHKQDEILSCLSILDDKIELNRKMNETLEQMALAIFKSWFIDFDPVYAKYQGKKIFGMDDTTAALFPDTFIQSELGEIPQGWRNISISEIVDLIGGGTPKTSVAEYWIGNIPWFSIADTPCGSDIWLIDTEKHISELGMSNSSTRLLREGTTIITARGTVGNLALVAKPTTMNQSCYGIQGKTPYGDYLIYFLIKNMIGTLKRSAHGSVFDTITRDTFNNAIVCVPHHNDRLLWEFEEKVAPLLELIKSNVKENATLDSTRDLLLPRLLSGEISIKDAVT